MEWVDGDQNVANIGVDEALQVPLLQLSRDDILKILHKLEEYFVFAYLLI